MINRKNFRRRGEEGFTLVEVLMAVFVFSILLSMAFAAVNSLSNARTALSDEEAELVALQKTVNLITRDLSQATSINVEPEENKTKQSEDETSGQVLLEFTDVLRNKFAYIFTEGSLLKRQVMAESGDSRIETQDSLRLMSDLGDVQFLLVDGESASVNVASGNNGAVSERWIEIALEHKTLGNIKRLVSNAYSSSSLFNEVDSPSLEIEAASGQQ